MTAPIVPQPATDATSPPSARGDTDETQAASSSDTGESLPAFGPPAEPGEVGTLGPYRLLKELGRGGMGAVYAAMDTRLERRLAMKVMLPRFAAEKSARERFLREARAAARVKHDNVVTVYEADERDGVPYIAMEFLEGYPLDQYLAKKGNPSIPQVLRIGAEAASGLAAAHKFGLVHRDIKPGNLWLEAPNGRVKVLDFGLAKPLDAEVEITRSGAVVGTPAYMSPEQARGNKVDPRSDLFSLGGLLYRLCTGKLPFNGPNTMAVLMALGTEEPPPIRSLNPAVPESLAELIHQLLAKPVDARPQSAAEVVKRLRAISAERATPRALPVEDSPSQPQVLYVPMQVTALPQQNPFAEFDSPETDLASSGIAEPTPAAQPLRRVPGGRRKWLAIGFAALAALVFGGVIIIIKNKDGTETKIEVPDGATVTIKGKDGKTLAQVKPDGGKPVTDDSADRKAAEYVLSLGGAVRVNGEEKDIKVVADLPKDRFILTGLGFINTKLTDTELARFKDSKGLNSLRLENTAVTEAGLAHFKDCTGLTALNLYNTEVTEAGLATFKDCAGLRVLVLGLSKATDAGLAHFKGCKRLTSLALDGTLVTDVGLANFKDCTGLLALYLRDTQITDTGLAHFKDCKGFVGINLINTQITDAGLAHLNDCKGLKLLEVKKTKVTAKGLEEFHAAVPGCKIEHDGGVIEPKK
ncbi:MAG: protein kinase [Gemmataceae bacterium]